MKITYKVETYLTRINYSGIAMTHLYFVDADNESDAKMAVRRYAKMRGYVAIIKDIKTK